MSVKVERSGKKESSKRKKTKMKRKQLQMERWQKSTVVCDRQMGEKGREYENARLDSLVIKMGSPMKWHTQTVLR